MLAVVTPGICRTASPAAGGQRRVAGAHLPHGGVELVGRQRPRGRGVLGAGPSSGRPWPGRRPGEDGAARVLPGGGVARLAQDGEHLVGAQAADQHPRRQPAQLGRRGPAVVEHLGQQAVVVGADVGLDRADPQPAVLPGDVVDQVVQRLRHRRAGGLGEEVVQVRRRPAGVQRPPDAGLRDPEDRGAAGGLDVGDHREGVGQLGDQRAGGDQREVGLGEHVVDRLGQQAAHAVGGAVLARRPAGPGRRWTARRRRGRPAGRPRRASPAPAPAGRPAAGCASAAAATRSSPARPDPGGNSASTVSAERRIAGAVCRTRSGDSGLTALPATSRCPTSDGSRTPASQPAASAAQRSGRSCSRQMS